MQNSVDNSNLTQSETTSLLTKKISFLKSISGRLISGLVALVIIGISVGGIGLYYLSSVEKTLNEITDVAAPSVETASDMIANIWETNKIAEEIIADEELADVEKLAIEFEEKAKLFYGYYDELDALISDDELHASLHQARKEHQEFLVNTDKMIKAHREELLEEAKAARLLEDFDNIGASLITMLDEFAEENEQEMAKAQQQGDQLVRSGQSSAADLNAILKNLFEKEYPVVEAALKLQRLVVEMQDTAGEYLAVEDPEKLSKPQSDFDALAVKARPLIEILAKYAESDEDKSDAENLKKSFETWFLTAAQDEQLFDTHRDMLEKEYEADSYTEALENDADIVAASLDKIANAAEAISNGADEASAAEVAKAQWATIIAVLLLIILSVALIYVIQRTIIKPIKQMTKAMQTLANGEVNITIPAIGQKDEVGDMAQAVQIFKENAIERNKLRQQRIERERQLEEEKRDATLKMADDLEASVKGVVVRVSDAAKEMNDAAQTMSNASTRTSTRAVAVASASEQATQTSQTVASAAEELSGSIRNINELVTDTASVASNGKKQVSSTNDAITNLSNRAEKIGNVINLINDIANQTNLLALNATIEAARAGDAGKGFAVVASEVKSLAIQTAKATEEIKEQISAMQKVTNQTVEEIETVSDAMSKINDMTGSVATAVDQQNQATQEIARNIQQTANGTEEVSANIREVNEEASQSSNAAQKVIDVVSSLNEQSENLNNELDEFLVRLRAV